MFEHVPERDVSCPACLGRHRKHTFDVHCRLGPPPPALDESLNPFDDARPDAPKGVVSPVAESEDDRYYSCPACRGRHRKHTYDHRCRFGNPSIAVEAVGRDHARAGQPRTTTFSSVVSDMDLPEPWEYACKVKVDDDEIDPADPTVLEYIELEKQNGISLTTLKEVRASTGAQREQWRHAM